MSPNLLLVIVPVVVMALLVILAVAVRGARARPDRALPPASANGGEAAAGMVCPFCRRRYDPAQAGGRCPGCGAASPGR